MEKTTEKQTPPKPESDISESVLNIENLAKDASQVESGKQLFKPELKSKGKRGPYKPRAGASSPSQAQSQQPTGGDTQQPTPPVALPSKEVVKPLITVIDGWTQRMIDAKCAMKPEEADGMATGLGLILDKYMPTVMDKYAPEFVFFSCASAWGLRCYAIAKTKQDAKRVEYQRRIKEQQLKNPPALVPNLDPNPNLNGKDHMDPEAELASKSGPQFSNPFDNLPRPN